MELKIVEEKENPLLDRKEISFKIVMGTTPSRDSVKDELVKKTRADRDMIVVQKLEQKFGENVIAGYAKIYNSQDSLKKIESEYILKRKVKTKEGKTENGTGKESRDEGKKEE